MLMRKYLPDDLDGDDWINVADKNGAMAERISALLDNYIDSSHLLVEIHRKLGDFLPRKDALNFICEHICKGQIQVSDRAFTGFVIIMKNGIARGSRMKNEQPTNVISDELPNDA
jgi:hypothetical protein